MKIEAGTVSSASPDTGYFIDIGVKSNPGIAIIGFDISYDSQYITLTNVNHSNDVFSASAFTPGNTEENPYKVLAYNANGNRTADGNLISLRFYVKEDCPSGTYDITISNVECYNIDEEEVLCEAVSGSITVVADDGDDNTASSGSGYSPSISGKPSASKDIDKADNEPEKPYKPENSIIFTINKKSADVFGEAKSNDVAPILRNSRTMLPARFVAESLGAKVEWFEDEEKVRITKDNTEILIFIGSSSAYVNNELKILDSPAFLENDRTYTPLRFVAENLGAKVYWEEDTQKVIVEKQ